MKGLGETFPLCYLAFATYANVDKYVFATPWHLRRFEVACKGRIPTEPPQWTPYAALTSGSLRLSRASNPVGWRFTCPKASKAGSNRADGAHAAANYAGNLKLVSELFRIMSRIR